MEVHARATEKSTEEAVRRRTREYCAAFNSGNVESVAAFYAKDSFFVAPGRTFIRGPEGFLKCGIIKQLMDLGSKRIEIHVADIVTSSDSASVIARFLLFNENGEEMDDGRLVNVWVKVEDEWLLKYDIFN